ncbi:MAG: hypothetical protein ACK4YQ_10675 [Phenylobacterium sp.]|uniref:hypothetical protein n=1 Tax=Phenylobacterium sp. TaxID=1871053 RepID=UPI00391D9834
MALRIASSLLLTDLYQLNMLAYLEHGRASSPPARAEALLRRKHRPHLRLKGEAFVEAFFSFQTRSSTKKTQDLCVSRRPTVPGPPAQAAASLRKATLPASSRDASVAIVTGTTATKQGSPASVDLEQGCACPDGPDWGVTPMGGDGERRRSRRRA